MSNATEKPLRLRHLEVLHWIMNTGSITGAAREMGTSQPTVSRDLADIERVLKQKLFVREGRRIKPTAEAEAIHAEIEKNYLCVDQMATLSAQILGGNAGRLRVASVPSLALQIIPNSIHDMLRARPKCTFDLQVHSRDSIIDFLLEKKFDVAFTVLGGRTDGLSILKLASVDAVCVFHPSSKLRRLKRITPRDLAGEQFISLAPNYISRQMVDEAFHRSGVEVDVFMTTQTAISACGVIKSGVGVTVIDPLTATFSEDENLCVRPFSPTVRFEYIAAGPHREVNRVLVQALIQHARHQIRQLQNRGSRPRRI